MVNKPGMNAIVEPVEVDPNLSFMQNIVRLAKERGVPIARIAEIAGIKNRGNLSPSNLSANPLPNASLMKIHQAYEIINLVAPQFKDQLEKLRGFPQRTADWYLANLINISPLERRVSLLEGMSFGEAFRYRRTQEAVNGRYMTLADCETDNIRSTLLSDIERGDKKVSISNAYQLISKLGYSPDYDGFIKFCEDTAIIYENHLLHKDEFGRALFIHLYPEGDKGDKEAMNPRGITQDRVRKEINGVLIKEYFAGRAVPNHSDVKKVSELFGFDSINEFYQSANQEYACKPGVRTKFEVHKTALTTSEERERPSLIKKNKRTKFADKLQPDEGKLLEK